MNLAKLRENIGQRLRLLPEAHAWKALKRSERVDDNWCLTSVRPQFVLNAKGPAMTNRAPSQLFDWLPFLATTAALVAAPAIAAFDVAGTYLPFLLLRLWMIGFAIYGVILAGRAGGFRRHWRLFYGIVGLTFAFVWGLEVEQWAVIDIGMAILVALSGIFLRTEPIATP